MIKILLLSQKGAERLPWEKLDQSPFYCSSGEEAASLMSDDPRIAVVVADADLPDAELHAFSDGLYGRAMPFELVLLEERNGPPAALTPIMQHYEIIPWQVRGESIVELLRKASQKALSARHLYEVRMGILGCNGFVGSSPKMRELRERLARAALNDHPVLITGPEGSGKVRLARLLHQMSPRRCNGSFRQVSADITSSKEASLRLFGGSTPGRNSEQVRGLIDEASGGTLSLLGIHRAGQNLHLRLTELVTKRNFCRVGSSRPETADVRLVLTACAEDGADDPAFGAELMQRLLSNMVEVPAIADCAEDIPAIVDHFSRSVWEKYRPESIFPGFHTDALEMLAGINWPLDRAGMEHFLERYFLMVGIDVEKAINARDLEVELTPWLETANKKSPTDNDLHALRFGREMRLDYTRMEHEALYGFMAIQKRRHGKRELAELFNKSSRWLEITLNNLADYFLTTGLRTKEELRRDQIWNRRYESRHRSPESSEEVPKA